MNGGVFHREIGAGYIQIRIPYKFQLSCCKHTGIHPQIKPIPVFFLLPSIGFQQLRIGTQVASFFLAFHHGDINIIPMLKGILIYIIMIIKSHDIGVLFLHTCLHLFYGHEVFGYV